LILLSEEIVDYTTLLIVASVLTSFQAGKAGADIFLFSVLILVDRL